MPRFIAVHTTPWTEEYLMKVAEEMPSQLPPGISYKLTYCDFDDGKFFCEWEAPNKEAIEQIFSSINAPYDAIYPVQLFTAAKMGFED
jgi:hypothetical protein